MAKTIRLANALALISWCVLRGTSVCIFHWLQINGYWLDLIRWQIFRHPVLSFQLFRRAQTNDDFDVMIGTRWMASRRWCDIFHYISRSSTCCRRTHFIAHSQSKQPSIGWVSRVRTCWWNITKWGTACITTWQIISAVREKNKSLQDHKSLCQAMMSPSICLHTTLTNWAHLHQCGEFVVNLPAHFSLSKCCVAKTYPKLVSAPADPRFKLTPQRNVQMN